MPPFYHWGNPVSIIAKIADMLLAPSDSSESNFFFTPRKTVVARGNTAQLPVLAFRVEKKNLFPVFNVKQS